MRELIHFDVNGGRLWATYHPPAASVPQAQVGVLFFNSGHVPRSGHASMSARAADQLAAQGFPCFRVDLPGLGDSEGPLPATTTELYQFVCQGGFVEAAQAVRVELERRYGLRSVVVGGLCGAATTALYLADREPLGVAGLFMFEPEFYLSEQEALGEESAESSPKVEASGWRSKLPVKRITSKVFSYWGWMRMLTRENEYARLFRYIPFPRQKLLDLLMDWDTLPAVANVPLVRAWQRVVQRGLPVLIITAEGKLRDVFFERIHRASVSRLEPATVAHFKLQGTNHIFTTGGAIDTSARQLLQWASVRFASRAPAPVVPEVVVMRNVAS